MDRDSDFRAASVELIYFASTILAASWKDKHQAGHHRQKKSRDAQTRAFPGSHLSPDLHQFLGPFVGITHEGPRPIVASVVPPADCVKKNVLIASVLLGN